MLVSISGYEGLYSVTEDGRVWSHRKNRWMKPGRIKYLHVNLFKNGVIKKHYVHRLVAEAFLPNPLNLPQINHKNGDPTDNRINNLEWVTNQQNSHHARDVLGVQFGIPARPVLGIHIKSGERLYMPSVIEAARFMKGASTSISKACQGKYRQAYGYTWTYLEP